MNGENKPVESEKLELSEEQKLKVLDLWNSRSDNPPSLEELVTAAWGENIDTRSKKGRVVRDFLVTRKLKYIRAFEYQKKDEVILTEQQKEFIATNCNTMKPLEIAKFLFENERLTQTDMESRAVIKYYNALDEKLIHAVPSQDGNQAYAPPKMPTHACARVNKYILDCISQDDMRKSTKIQNSLKSLIRFCHQQRFSTLMSQLQKQEDKDLVEGRYISYVWDKPDLSEEELDLYINLCCSILDYTHMRKELDKLQEMFDNCADDSEGKKISMSIVESIKNTRKDMDENIKRQQNLTEILQGKRNQRINIRVKQEASLVQLIDFWKNYENRKQILELAEARKKAVKEEIERIKNMDELVIQVFGFNESELI